MLPREREDGRNAAQYAGHERNAGIGIRFALFLRGGILYHRREVGCGADKARQIARRFASCPPRPGPLFFLPGGHISRGQGTRRGRRITGSGFQVRERQCARGPQVTRNPSLSGGKEKKRGVTTSWRRDTAENRDWLAPLPAHTRTAFPRIRMTTGGMDEKIGPNRTVPSVQPASRSGKLNNAATPLCKHFPALASQPAKCICF